MQTWLTMTAAELGRSIAAGEIDPVALTQTYLDAIAAHPHRDTIYARTTADRALAEAEAAARRARLGQRRSPLDGVPVSWKDLFDTAGVATEAGTAMMAGRTPDKDATVLRNATDMGLVCLGKTHLSEIAFSGLGYNPITATPPCVNDPEAAPGGSSSGAGTSVAFNLAPLAIGSDTGGSVRIPAAWNDLVGFKPTHGALSTDGAVPLCASFDTVGPLARTVEDATLAFTAMGGPSIDLRGTSLTGKRFLILETIALDAVDDAPARAFADACARLTEAGATLTRAKVPSVADAFTLSAPLYTGEAWSYWGPFVEAQGDKMYDRIRERVSAGRDVHAADFIAGWAKLRVLRAEFAAQTAGYDAILAPTVPILPPKIATLLADEATYVETNLKALRNTRIGNLMGLCAVTLPTGTASCGLMLMGRAGRDAALLRVSAAAERALA